MKLSYATGTDIGNVRAKNEDYFFAGKIKNDEYLFIVADGMGGHKSGEVASYTAVTAFVKEIKKSSAEDIEAELKRILLKVNSLLLKESTKSTKNRGMGTTLSVLYVKEENAYIAHIGDSRIYSYTAAGAAGPHSVGQPPASGIQPSANGPQRTLRDLTPAEGVNTPRPLRDHLPASLKEGKNTGPVLEQLTEDHSLVGKFVRDGFITKEQALTHPKRNVLYQSVGLKQNINVQTVGPIPLYRGRKFLLCSDGLNNEITDAGIEKFLQLKSSESAAEGLIKKAKTGRGGDNITVIVVSTEKMKRSP